MRKYSYTINGAAYDVRIDSIQNGVAKVNVNGLDFDVQIHGNLCEEDLTNSQPPSNLPPRVEASDRANEANTSESSPLGGIRGGLEGEPILAPLPGVITKILVATGQKVKKGDTVLVLEAMKMENNIEAPCDGTLKKFMVQKGDSVLEGAPLAVIG